MFAFPGPDTPGASDASTASPSRHEVAALKLELQRHLLIIEGLWELLKEKHGHTDEDLARHMVQVDLRDGTLDGRAPKTPPQPCPACGRTLVRHRPKCMYCGELITPNPFQR